MQRTQVQHKICEANAALAGIPLNDLLDAHRFFKTTDITMPHSRTAKIKCKFTEMSGSVAKSKKITMLAK